MGSPITSVEVRFYDRSLQRTANPADSFEVVDTDVITTRFVAAYQFVLRGDILTICLNHVVLHFFPPVALLSHLDYFVNTLRREGTAQRRKEAPGSIVHLAEVEAEERQMILDVLLRVVIGGGAAGKEREKIAAEWFSGSFKTELGFTKPRPPLVQVLQEDLVKRLTTILQPRSAS